MDLLKFMKNWTLPLAMLAGVIGYFVFANFTFLEPTKPFMNGLISFLTPSLIFAQLLLTFCKIEPKELVPRVWHGWLLAIQAISCGIIALLLIFCPMDESYKEIFEAAMVCLILSYCYGSGSNYGETRWKCFQFDYLYITFKYFGCNSSSFGISIG